MIAAWQAKSWECIRIPRLPVRTRPVVPLWCDLGLWSRTVVIIKLLRTSAFNLMLQNLPLNMQMQLQMPHQAT